MSELQLPQQDLHKRFKRHAHEDLRREKLLLQEMVGKAQHGMLTVVADFVAKQRTLT